MSDKKKPDFTRQNSHKHKRVPESWRKPRGTHSPRRRKEKHVAPMPNVGFRTPAEERDLHPSGYAEVLVHRPADLDDVDPETEAVRVASGVGGRKRAAIAEKADDMGLKLLNVPQEDEEEQ